MNVKSVVDGFSHERWDSHVEFHFRNMWLTSNFGEGTENLRARLTELLNSFDVGNGGFCLFGVLFKSLFFL